MTKQNWLQRIVENQDILANLIAYYHPTNSGPAMKITAPNAEKACAAIRKDIKKDINFTLESAVTRFNNSVLAGDCDAIYGLLQETWFGVPESTDCWQIRGFAECVDMLDDPWDEE